MPRSYTAELGTALAGRYLIEEHLGKGGMATVYRARDLKHDRAFALKVLNPELGAVLGAERFLTEIKVTATMQHPNLLTLIDSGEVSGLLYYVMPLLDGETLRAYIARSGQLPVNDAVRITTGIAQALAYAHARDIIHRDLKPENVILQHGQPIVLDFGIALALRNAGGARMTQTGVAMGTPQYMSPEQASGEKQVDTRVDIYALGTLLFEMLAGEAPHTGPTPQSVMSRVITTEARAITSVRPLVPAHIAAAIAKALARNPADRFNTVDEFVVALQRPAHSVTTGTGPTDQMSGISSFRQGHSTTILITVALATLVVGFLAGRLSTP
jgi:serine/threonine-protein kinase